MFRCLPIVLLCLPACMPAADPPAARGVLPPPRRPAPPVERPVVDPPDAPPRPHHPPTAVDPAPAPGPVVDLAPAALPTAWPNDAFDLVAERHARRVIASEDVVGIAAAQRLLAISGDGGVFRADAFGRLRPERTQLPSAISRTFSTPDVLIACTPPLDHARFSLDDGHTWGSLGFQCGHRRARTIDGAGAQTYALAGDQLRIGPLPAGAATYRALPVADVEALGALGDTVLLVGGEAVAISKDAGARFDYANRPREIAAVRDVAFVGKGVVLLAGEAARDGAALLRSTDLGRSWTPVDLPRRLDDLAALAVDPRGVVVAVPTDASAGAVISHDGGRSFEPLPPDVLAQGAVIAHAGGFVAGAPEGLLRGIDAPAARLGLSDPLHAAVFTHPRVAVGIGRTNGVFRTLDGGQTWAPYPAGRWIRFADLARIDDHAVMLVGEGILWRSDDAGLRWDQRPLPSSCAARWVRFAPDGIRGTVGCADGSLLESADRGYSWRVGPPPPAALGPVVWWDGKRWAISRDGRLMTDGDGAFAAVPSPVEAPAHLAWTPTGLSLLGRTGQGAHLRDAAWQAWGWIEPPADSTHHVPLGDGGALVLAADRLVRVSPRVAPRVLARDVLDLRLTGDGGLLVFNPRGTTLLEAR